MKWKREKFMHKRASEEEVLGKQYNRNVKDLYKAKY